MTTDEYLRPSDVEAEYRISESTLSTWRANGTGPASFRLGKRRVVYRRSVLEAWIATQEQAAAS